MSDVMNELKHSLSGEHEKPKKVVHKMHIEKAKSGGHIITHEHTHPAHHPDEKHVTKGDDELASHVLQNMGTPNPGEAEADAGQSGIPAGGAAPTPGASAGAAPGGAPSPAMA
jgi:hypothetical protein